jgi:hypothetical protein
VDFLRTVCIFPPLSMFVGVQMDRIRMNNGFTISVNNFSDTDGLGDIQIGYSTDFGC